MSLLILIACLLTASALVFAGVKFPLKAPVKYSVFALAVFFGLGGVAYGVNHGAIPLPGIMRSLIPQKTTTFATNNTAAIPASYELPATPTADVAGCKRFLIIPWNGASSITVANGGARTTPDSAVKKFSGGCLAIESQGDYGVMKDELVKFASGWSKGDDTQGAAFVVIMGDAAGSFITSVKPRLDKLGQNIKVVGVAGFSYGEDKCMGPPLNGNPQSAKGSLIAAVPYDGDQHVCQKWASDNGIKINTDNTTFDPDAINFSDTTSFDQADDKFSAAACEDRAVVKDGKKTGEKKHICINGVATWTPGDVAVVRAATSQGRQLATWASTRDYNQQMPASIIGNADWMSKHRAFVIGVLRAVDRGSFEIRSGNDGLDKLGKTQAAVFGGAGGDAAKPEFWSKYYVGAKSSDGSVDLGGSRVIGLAETRDYFGLTPGTLNTYKGVLDVFCGYDHTFYPKDVPQCPKFEDAVDTTYVTAALQGVNAVSAKSEFTEQKSISQAVSNRPYSIEFETGSAKITPKSAAVLNTLASQAGMTSLRIRVSGHTDNTGNATANLGLSRQRAQAVIVALNGLAPETFPVTRFEAPQGYGDTEPVDASADQNSAAERAKNRRVEITLGH